MCRPALAITPRTAQLSATVIQNTRRNETLRVLWRYLRCAKRAPTTADQCKQVQGVLGCPPSAALGRSFVPEVHDEGEDAGDGVKAEHREWQCAAYPGRGECKDENPEQYHRQRAVALLSRCCRLGCSGEGDILGALQPLDVVGKPGEWFTFDNQAQLRFRSREHPLHGEALEPRKFLLARQETYANPYGFMNLSMCFWPTVFKRGGLKFWVTFTEKYGTPWLVGKQPRGTPGPEVDALLDKLEAMIQDAVAAIPDDSSNRHPGGRRQGRER